MTDQDDIARRAREIGERAAQIADDARESQELREELDRLDRELARLDEERRRLDEDLSERTDDSTTGEHASDRPAWTETLADVLSDVSERISALGAGGWPWRSSETIDRSVAVDGPLPVVIENRAGSIKVETGDDRTVTAKADLFAPGQSFLDEMTFTAERQGHEIVVRAAWPEQRRGRRARLTVTVPTGSTVRATTASGSVTVKDTHAAVTAATKGGSITLAGTDGAVDARTAGGSVHVADHAGSVRVTTSGGSLQLAGHLTGAVDATTAGGSIHIEGVDGAPVTATTSGGSIGVRGRLTGESRIRTSGGSVNVAIPSDSQVRIDATGTSASCDFSELHTARGRIEGTLGDGRDGTIELRTTGGSVTLTKT